MKDVNYCFRQCSATAGFSSLTIRDQQEESGSSFVGRRAKLEGREVEFLLYVPSKEVINRVVPRLPYLWLLIESANWSTVLVRVFPMHCC